ncbi:YcxB family protein [Reichenbachiella carrageenanivorans]|uniref:YcxB family protein n=1 Tax=Reichenbachiella carrageenanivorans TaxID=2979869 RepID=A0ABY6DAQ4_9BACT|nr:YcxB family protein [Reichenbachiella carrageenanivorans]UXX80930.1 YcxB family protein [Reichenbachiella carrageenanivorans]
MNVKTKKYQMTTGTYVKLAFGNLIKDQWWVILIYLAICAGYVWIPSHWWVTGATIALTLYVLFWLIQFAGISQLEQGKFMFEKLSYEINSQQILIKLNAKQGMPMKWDSIKRAKVGKDYFLFTINKAQHVHLPFRIFNSNNEVKFVETILKRKGFIKE